MPGVELGSAHVEIRATQDKLKGDLDSAQGAVSSAMGNVAKVAAGAGLAIGAAFVAAGVAAFKLGESFDSAYDSIRSVTGKTGAELEGLKDDFKAVAGSVPDDIGLVSQTLAELHQRTGATGEGLQGLTKSVLDFSRVTGTDASSNVALATRMFGDWSIATEDQAGSLDKIFRASQATGIGVDELMGKVVQFGAPLRAMGFSLDESAAMLGKWEKEGVNSELVLGSMRIAMGHFADAGVPMRAGLDETIAKIQELGPGAAATSLAMEVFGARAGPDMAAAILEGRFELGELVNQVANGGETVGQAAADTQDGAERMSLAMNRLSLALEPVASGVFNVVGLLVEKLAPAIEGMVTALAPLIATIGDSLVPAFESIFKWLGDVGTKWGETTGGITTEGSALWDTLEPIFSAIESNLKKFWEEIFPELEKTWTTVVGNLKTATEAFGTFWNEHWDTIQSVLTVAVDLITIAIDTWFGVMQEAFKTVLALIRGDWEGAWNSLLAMFSVVGDGIVAAAGVWLGVLQDALDLAWGGIKSAAGTAWQGIADAITDAFRSITQPIRDVVDGVMRTIQPAIDAISKITSFSPPDFGDVLGQISKLSAVKVPGFAEGVHNFAGGLALVGERGPELLNLPGGADVLTASVTAGLLRGGGDRPIELTVNLDGEVLTRAVWKGLKAERVSGADLGF